MRSHPSSALASAALLGLTALVAVSCVSMTHELLGDQKYPPRPEGHRILVYESLEDLKQPFVKVALISAATGSKLASAMGSIKGRARSLGADAVVVYGHGLHRGTGVGFVGGKSTVVATYQESASVLAIRFEDADLGLTETGLAIYGLIGGPAPGPGAEAGASAFREAAAPKIELARLVEESVAGELEVIDWSRRVEVQGEMLRKIKRQLLAGGMPEQELDSVSAGIVEIFKAKRGR